MTFDDWDKVRDIARSEAQEVVKAIIDPMKLYVHWRIIENNVKKKEGNRD